MFDEKSENIKPVTGLQSIEKAQEALTEKHDYHSVIKFFQDYPDNTGEFCLQVFEAYLKKGKFDDDSTGILQLSGLINELIKFDKSKNIKQETSLKSVEEAEEALNNKRDYNAVIGFLSVHPDDVGEFCLQVFEAYLKKGKFNDDSTGILDLSSLINEIIKKISK